MIPTLLWQCPLCHLDEALVHKTHWSRPDEVWCTRCRTTWEVQRVIGADYRLKVVRGDPATLGRQRPLAEWYDLMKAGTSLVPRKDPSLPLEPGEEMYVQSGKAQLLLEADNPLHRGAAEEEAPVEKEGSLGLSLLKRWDTGRLALTSERLIWRGSRKALTFWLRKVNSVHADLYLFLGLLYGLRLYKFRFYQDSNLKWLTYTALAARRIEQLYGHQISLSNY